MLYDAKHSFLEWLRTGSNPADISILHSEDCKIKKNVGLNEHLFYDMSLLSQMVKHPRSRKLNVCDCPKLSLLI